MEREAIVIDDEHQAESFAVLLLPGWRHPRTNKLHIRRDCPAVHYNAKIMSPVLIRLDDDSEVGRVLDDENLCRHCFTGLTPSGSTDPSMERTPDE